MFDIGLSEIVLIAVVALWVLGPERLPKAARMAGWWMRRARGQWNSVKAELENELASEELRRSIRNAQSELHDGLDATRETIRFTATGNSADEAVGSEPPAIALIGQPATPSGDHRQTAIAPACRVTPASGITGTSHVDAGSAHG